MLVISQSYCEFLRFIWKLEFRRFLRFSKSTGDKQKKEKKKKIEVA